MKFFCITKVVDCLNEIFWRRTRLYSTLDNVCGKPTQFLVPLLFAMISSSSRFTFCARRSFFVNFYCRFA